MLGFDGGAIGADIYCDRTGIHCRTIGDCAKVLDALKDPENGYYDPRDPYTTVPRSSVIEGGYSQARHRQWRSRRAQRRAPWRDPRVDGLSARFQNRAAHRRRRQEGNQKRAGRQTRRDAGRIRRSALAAGPDLRKDDGRFPPRAGAAGAGVHARSAVPARRRRAAGVQGVCRGHRPDRIHARQGVRLRQRCSRSTIASRWRTATSSRRRTSTSQRSSIRNWRTRSVSTSRNI